MQQVQQVQTIDIPYYLVRYIVFELELPLLVFQMFLFGIFVRLVFTVVIVCPILLRFAVKMSINRMYVLYLQWQIKAMQRQIEANRAEIEANRAEMEANLAEMEANRIQIQ